MYGVLSVTGGAAAVLAACNGLTGIGDYRICGEGECDAGQGAVDSSSDGPVGTPDASPDGGGGPSRGLVCSADQWCFEMPRPAGAFFTSAAASTLDDYFVGGRAGILIRRRGGAWSPNLLPQIRDEYRSLYLTDDRKTLWAAVGKSTLKINVETLTFETVNAAPPGGTPLSIHGSGSDDLWMLATDGVYRLEGGGWVRELALVATDGQVFVRTKQDVWLASNALLGSGRLLHRTGGGGGTWVDVTAAEAGAPTADSFVSVYSDDTDKVWAGGFRLQRKNPDAGWSEPLPSSLQAFRQMGGGDVQAYGARGSEGVFALRPNSTASLITGSTPGFWSAIGFTQPQSAVAAGDTMIGTLAVESFLRADEGIASDTLTACWAATPQSMIAVGEGKVVYTRSESGGAFGFTQAVVPGNPSRLVGAAGVSATDAWVIGNKYAAHFDGKDWSMAGVPAVGKLTGVAATASGAWVVGEEGTILRCLTAGSPLTCTVHAPFAAVSPDAGSIDLRAVWAGSDTEVWVVGDKGFVARFDGAAWALQPPATAPSCNFGAIHGGATHVLMAGNGCGQFMARAGGGASALDFAGSGGVTCTGAYVVDSAAGYIACSGLFGAPIMLKAEPGALKVRPELIPTSGAPLGMCGSGKRVWAVGGAAAAARGVIAVKDL